MEKQQASIDGVQKEHKLNVVKDVFFQGRRIIGYELNYVPSQSYFAGKIYFVNGKEREARFLKFKKSEEALAKKIFTQTSKLNHAWILKPYFFAYYEPQNIWILCYDRFDQLLGEMVDDEDPAILLRTNNPDRLIRWWRNVIRNLLRAVKHIHFHDLFHMGLEDTRNYVVVSNGIRIINVQNSLEDLDDPVYPEQVNSWRIKDLKALRNMLRKNILLPGYDSWLDRNYFFDFFDNEDYEYCAYVKQLKNHPFLLTHAERRQWFVEIRLLVNESELKRILDDRAFDEYRDWNWFKDKAPRIQRTYKDPNNKYDGKSVRDLVEFLKDVYLDGEEAADTEVRRSYMKFLNQIYAFI
ncbi:hypothetical protein Pyn_08524 [Prunus yedoensis var. nudiflora]|uniref:Protein kinase domain-containing protein n=1 Tax=Prunus yedoensis var. nudiflora TaxID=2094558 RepID=A0A315A8L8_PRUYE|nr:hypothetical protein Pyn_08524 [Prunus yedoensis var. nudiflora]